MSQPISVQDITTCAHDINRKNHTMFFHIFPHNEGTEAKTY